MDSRHGTLVVEHTMLHDTNTAREIYRRAFDTTKSTPYGGQHLLVMTLLNGKCLDEAWVDMTKPHCRSLALGTSGRLFEIVLQHTYSDDMGNSETAEGWDIGHTPDGRRAIAASRVISASEKDELTHDLCLAYGAYSATVVQVKGASDIVLGMIPVPSGDYSLAQLMQMCKRNQVCGNSLDGATPMCETTFQSHRHGLCQVPMGKPCPL